MSDLHGFEIDADLIVAYLECDLPPRGLDAFNDRLASDPAFADAFTREAHLHTALRRAHTPAPVSASPKPDVSPPRANVRISPRPIPFLIYTIATAAALLLTAAIVVVYLLAFTTEPQPEPAKPNNPGPPVATLIEHSGSGDLRTPHGFTAEGESYGRGEYTLTSGVAEFMLTNAVNVQLRGESRMVMHDDMAVSLTHGSAAFVCPSGATGFTVHLPDRSRIVDLGTAFRVEIAPDGRSRLRVSEGSVAVYRAGETGPTIVVAGHSATLDEDRTTIAASPTIIKNRLITEPGDIENDGRLVLAVNLLERADKAHWNAALPVTVNGIPFVTADDAIGPDWQAAHHRDASNADATGEARRGDPLRELLTSIAFTSSPHATINLSRLEPGRTYRIQLLHYEKPGESRTARIVFDGQEPIPYTITNRVENPAGDGLIFTWVAHGDSLTIRYEHVEIDPVLSAIVVHEIDRDPVQPNPKEGENDSPERNDLSHTP